METSFLSRLRSAWSMVVRGGSWEGALFNRVSSMGGESSSDKLDKPMAQSAWVMRAIKKISGPISAVPLQFASDRRGGEQLLADPELAEFWNRPAVGLSFSDWIESTVGWLKLSGESFWILGDSWMVPFPDVNASRREQLIVARPDRMRHIVSKGKLLGWAFQDGDGRQHTLLPEQVIHCKFWNPYDDFRGLAEYKAAEVAASADYLAGQFNKNLQANNGDQGVYVVAKNGIPSDDQREQIVAALREKRAAQQRGQFKPIFLTGDITIEDPKITTPDANFISQRTENRHEIFIAFGVPPSMADVAASYSIGSASDRFMLLEETCIPLSEKIADQVEAAELRRSGNVVYGWFNWDEHSVMQAVRRERIDTALKMWGTGMPMKAINDYLQLSIPEFDGWEIGYLPFSVTPVGAPELTQSPDYSEPAVVPPQETDQPEEQDQAVTEMMRVLREPNFQRARDPKEIALWKSRMAKRRETVRAYESKFSRVLMTARREVLDKLQSAKVKGLVCPTIKAVAADFMFNLDSFRNAFQVGMRNVAASALEKAGAQMFTELGLDDPFKFPPAKAIAFLKERENKLSGTPQDIFDAVQSALQAGLNEGESMDKLADRARGAFNGISKERAMRIAMTETSAAYGVADQEAMSQAGIEYKKWLTSGNANVRPAHAAANGQVVRLDEAFDVGGEALMHPGDPLGSPENVINCHCCQVAATGPNE